MPQFTDQLNRKITVKATPERIISLVPSQTELLVDLGLEDKLVGITKFCVHPKGLKKSKTIIGGTKNFHFDKIQELKPDIIIGNKEENYQEGIEKLAENYPVWMSDIFNLENAYDMMRRLGELTKTAERAKELIKEINQGFSQNFKLKGSVVYLIWENPLIAVGTNTFIDSILQGLGLENLILKSRYPQFEIEDLIQMEPELLFLSSEPYPFKNNHINFFQNLLPTTKVMLVDGEMFSWYGSRLRYAPNYFKKLKFS